MIKLIFINKKVSEKGNIKLIRKVDSGPSFPVRFVPTYGPTYCNLAQLAKASNSFIPSPRVVCAVHCA